MAIFHLLADGDGEITYDEFITGVSRLKGQARAVDLIALQIDAQKIIQRLSEIQNRLFPDSVSQKKAKVPGSASSGSSAKPMGEPTTITVSQDRVSDDFNEPPPLNERPPAPVRNVW